MIEGYFGGELAWQLEKDGEAAVDSSGELPNGDKFTGPIGLTGPAGGPGQPSGNAGVKGPARFAHTDQGLVQLASGLEDAGNLAPSDGARAHIAQPFVDR